jgi:hypothetical protein
MRAAKMNPFERRNDLDARRKKVEEEKADTEGISEKVETEEAPAVEAVAEISPAPAKVAAPTPAPYSTPAAIVETVFTPSVPLPQPPSKEQVRGTATCVVSSSG